MSDIVSHASTTGLPATGRLIDRALAVFTIAWTAEALGQIPLPGQVLTAVVYAGFGARFLLHLNLLIGAVRTVWWVLPFPILAIASAIWSPVPTASAVGGVQLAFTVLIAVYLGTIFRPGELLQLLGLGLGAAVVASAVILAAGLNPAYAPGGGYQGVFLQKNGLGQRAALLLILAAALVCRPGQRGAALLWIGVVAALWMVVVSRSVTSQVMVLVALFGGGMAVAWQKGGAGRGYAAIISTTLCVAVVAALLILNVDPFERLLEHFGKARDLTGRVVLWSIAWQQGAEAPILGHGYFAFWQSPGNAQDVALIRLLYGSTVAVFHNFLLEAYVGLGIPGVAALMALVVGSGWTMVRGSAGSDQVWLAILFAVSVCLSLLGASLSRPHEVVLVMLVALSVSLRLQLRGEP